jgi:uncharacterized membrane protein YbhN (UPF0104 family)
MVTPTHASSPVVPSGSRWSTIRHRVVWIAAFVLGVTLLALGLPRVAGASWHQIGDVLGSLTVTEEAALVAVWLAGLWVHTIALSAALPGLSHRRAFFLNITGSSVSNLLPLGGAAGSVVNYWAVRSWGFRTADFIRWALVTNIWDALSRLAVPGVALVWLSATGWPSTALRDAGLGASLVLLLALALTVAALRIESWARTAGAALDRLARVVRRSPPPGTTFAELTVAAQRSITELVADAWQALTVGKAGYAALQAALLWLCLSVVHVQPPAAVIFAAFALERVLSLAVVSPAATWIVERGMTGYLGGAGAAPAGAAAAVLQYRILVVGMEVPVGGLLLLWWLARRIRGNVGPKALLGRGRSRLPVMEKALNEPRTP